MRRAGQTAIAAGALCGVMLAVSAVAGDHSPRVRPPNAVQPPGASFEKASTRGQKTLYARRSPRRLASL